MSTLIIIIMCIVSIIVKQSTLNIAPFATVHVFKMYHTLYVCDILVSKLGATKAILSKII